MSTTPVRIPKLGMFEEGMRLTAWLVDNGARVEAGQPLFELESDKATQECEAEAAGWVRHELEPEADVEVGQVIGLIAATEDAYRTAAATSGADAEPVAVAVSPRAQRALIEHGFEAAWVAAWAEVEPGHRLTDRHVLAYAEAHTGGSADEPAAPDNTDSAGSPKPADLTVTDRIALRGRRGTIARRMTESLRDAPQLTSVLEIETTAAVALRERSGARHVSVFVAAAAQALRAEPALNALVIGDEIRLVEEVNIAVAVQTDDGVIAPVIHRADRLDLEALNARIGELVDRARAGRAGTADLTGATFTVSSSGASPVDLTTAILNPPQVGILWLGRIRPRPIVRDGSVVAAPTLQACLTYDHRAVDGAPAARFLGAFARALQASS
jgi:pyruvate/2-oxoglutarate dehydrogenase complex dihydrolipoamide acyltransferase (E2) component